jgi:hypothetical protein
MNTYSESYYIQNIGFTVKEIVGPHTNQPSQKVITNYLLDNTGISGATTPVPAIISLNLNQHNAIEYFITPENESHFKVQLPNDVSRGFLMFSLGKSAVNWENTTNINTVSIPLIINFHGLEGTPPRITYAYLFMTETTNNRYDLLVQGEFQTAFSFNSVSLFAPFSQRQLMPEEIDYVAAGYSIFPTDLPSTNPNLPPVFVSFGYFTTDKNSTQNCLTIESGYNPDPSICEALQHQIDNLRHQITTLEQDIAVCRNDLEWSWEVIPESTRKRYVLRLNNQIKSDEEHILQLNQEIQNISSMSPNCNLK